MNKRSLCSLFTVAILKHPLLSWLTGISTPYQSPYWYYTEMMREKQYISCIKPCKYAITIWQLFWLRYQLHFSYNRTVFGCIPMIAATCAVLYVFNISLLHSPPIYHHQKVWCYSVRFYFTIDCPIWPHYPAWLANHSPKWLPQLYGCRFLVTKSSWICIMESIISKSYSSFAPSADFVFPFIIVFHHPQLKEIENFDKMIIR